MTGLQTQILPPTMPLSLATQPSQSSNHSLSSVQSSTPSSGILNPSLATPGSMHGLHPNAAYYPMQLFYYPTAPVSPSIYLQTGHMHPGPMTLVLRGTFSRSIPRWSCTPRFVFQEMPVNIREHQCRRKKNHSSKVVFRLIPFLLRQCSDFVSRSSLVFYQRH